MIGALLLAIGEASIAAAPFAPPLDRPLRVLVHQERVQAGATRRYEIERRLVFRRSDAGLVAEMTLVRVWQDGGGEAGRHFEAAAGVLKGRTIRFHLSATGAVTAIDDEAALWSATLAGIAAIAAPMGSPATGMARDPGAALAALSPDQRQAVLASPLTSIIASDAGDRTAGAGPITIGGILVAGRSLSGTRVVTTGTDKRLHIAVHAASAGAADAVTLDRERIVDPLTGLAVDARETQTTGPGGTGQTTRQRVTVEPMVS